MTLGVENPLRKEKEIIHGKSGSGWNKLALWVFETTNCQSRYCIALGSRQIRIDTGSFNWYVYYFDNNEMIFEM